jgi:hypothetical protein
MTSLTSRVEQLPQLVNRVLFPHRSLTELSQKVEYKIYKINSCERGTTTKNRKHF